MKKTELAGINAETKALLLARLRAVPQDPKHDHEFQQAAFDVAAHCVTALRGA